MGKGEKKKEEQTTTTTTTGGLRNCLIIKLTFI